MRPEAMARRTETRPEADPEARSAIIFRPATPARWKDLERLFGANGACGGCWCMFWKQSGPAYRAGQGEPNRRAFRAAVRRGPPPGLIAYAGKEPVGWVAVEPRARYARLAASRNLAPVDDRPVWSVPCFFVDRRHRGRGLAGRLLEAAAAHASRRGARLLEGYPVDPAGRLADAWLYTGRASTFARLGFAEVARRARTRPVMRLELGGR
jgi:GNAT superfamily N-acetyltransferase